MCVKCHNGLDVLITTLVLTHSRCYEIHLVRYPVQRVLQLVTADCLAPVGDVRELALQLPPAVPATVERHERAHSVLIAAKEQTNKPVHLRIEQRQ